MGTSNESWNGQNEADASAFSKTALEFCAFLEGHKKLDNQEFFRECHRRVAKLHDQALNLPDAVDVSQENHKADVQEAAGELYTEIQRRLGPQDVFWVVFHPYEKEDPIQATISDGLHDIYSDLKDGLIAFANGSIQDAVWSWKESHRSHWGKHAVETLIALQELAGGDYFVG